MLLLKLIRSLIKALHSEGTPGQVAAGLAMGAILGLTPLLSLHNALVFALVLLLNVSFPAAMAGWVLFTPLGFLLDPLFHAIGDWMLLDAGTLRPIWTTFYNVPIVPLTNFNNTILLGSLFFSLLLFTPLFLSGRWGVDRYRATVGATIQRSRFYQGLKASKLYDIYRLFRP